jgi:predicted RNA-binding Zn ribbon-like protein
MREGFRPDQRLIELANAVREDPALSRAALARLLAGHGEFPADLTERAFPEKSAAALRAAVVRLTDTVLTEADTDRAALALNALLAEYAAPPRLSRHDGHPWHLHADRGDDAPWDEWLIASSALALARILSEHGRAAWGECDAPGCSRLYLGTGPGSPRRYCSARCSSRARVAAHRRRGGGTTGTA